MKWVIVWVLFSYCAVNAAAQANVDPDARSKVTTLEQVWGRALTAGDLKALDALADPELIYIDTDGSLMTKSEVLSYAKSAHLQRIVTRISKVQVFNDTVVVNGTYESKEKKNGMAVTREGQFTDTWFSRNSTWVCIAAQATPELGSTK
jgi:hypothetical protein